MLARSAITVLAVATTAMSTSAQGVESSVKRATIYPGGVATLERRVTTQVSAGSGAIEVEGLHAELVADSARVSVDSGELTIGAVETSTEAVGEPPRERERQLRERIDELEAKQQTHQDRAKAARSQLRFIKGLSKLPQQAESPRAFLNPEQSQQWDDLWGRLGDGTRAAYETLRTNERQAESAKESIETLTKRLNQLGQSQREALTVTIPYRAASDQSVALTLTYRTQGVRWEPLYEARLDTSAGKVELVRLARVRQATGSDWQDVKLRLATSQPVQGQQPDPQTWWLSLGSPGGGDASAKERYSGRAQLNSSSAGKKPRDLLADKVRTTNAEFAATYVVERPVDLPADNQPRNVPIGTQTLATELSARVYPQQDKRAWLTATTSWDGDAPLPSGKMARFRDGSYVGDQQLDSWAPGEERGLGFGADPRVDVSFEPARDETGESGWITTRTSVARTYELDVTNRHTRALPVEVFFRLPVGRHEDIEVSEDFSASPAQRGIDDKQGVHRWDMELDGGAARSLQLGYRVTYPEDKEINGL